MTKRELVIEIAERLGYTQNEVADVVQQTLDTIMQCLSEGHRLEIRNFGVFEVKQRDARMGRNPRTGQEVPISGKRVPSFKPGKALKERVQVAPPAQEPGASLESAEPSTSATPAPFPDEQSGSGMMGAGSGEQGSLF